MHLAFKYVTGRKNAFALYNALLAAHKEVYTSYQPDTNQYFIRFYQ